MIQANELRIGNLFHIHDEKGKIDSIDGFSFFDGWDYELKRDTVITMESGSTSLNDLHPIPLTEEWLLKLGFEKTKSLMNEGHDAYELKSWGRVLLMNGRLFSDEFYFLDGMSQEIQYVHQLQNLFFALTGNELTHRNNTAASGASAADQVG